MNGVAYYPQRRQPPWEELIRQQLEQTQADLRNKKLLLIQKQQQQQQIKYKQIQIQKQELAASQSIPRKRNDTSTNKMAAYLVCLTAAGGVPLFSRKIGDLKTLPFPVIGSLNGVHMFAKSKTVTLLSTATKDAQVVWKVFHDSIMLIFITTQQEDDKYGIHLLQSVFDAMVLLVGLDDLTRIKNVERLKKDLRCCFKLVDTLLYQSEAEHGLVGQMTLSVDCLLTPNHQVLQNHLEYFVESLGTMYGCLLVHGRLVVATKKWWTLSECEAGLLAMFISCCSKMTTRDIPIFLPVESPSVPHRLVTFCLLPGVEVCVLCGPTPSITEMEKRNFCNYWRNCQDVLLNTSKLYPKNCSVNVTLDSNILAFILVNTETKRCLCSTQPVEKAKLMNSKQCQEILRAFYKWICGSFFVDTTQEVYRVFHTRLKHSATETYMCTDTFKCFAQCNESYQLFLLFNNQIPTYSLRSISHKTLDTIIVKNVHF
uniref:Protein fuzzy homolog n=1 Tax=Strigamia maritima TaxID=126957 RepID=T1JJ89_STRMM